jgi:hypothetical protein
VPTATIEPGSILAVALGDFDAASPHLLAAPAGWHSAAISGLEVALRDQARVEGAFHQADSLLVLRQMLDAELREQGP